MLARRNSIVGSAAGLVLAAGAAAGIAGLGVFDASADPAAPIAADAAAEKVSIRITETRYNGLDLDLTLAVKWEASAGKAIAQIAPPILTNDEGEALVASEGMPRDGGGAVQWLSFHNLPASFLERPLTLQIDQVFFGNSAEVAASRTVVGGPWRLQIDPVRAVATTTTLPISGSLSVPGGTLELTRLVQSEDQTVVFGQLSGVQGENADVRAVLPRATLALTDGALLPSVWSEVNGDGSVELRFAAVRGQVELQIPSASGEVESSSIALDTGA